MTIATESHDDLEFVLVGDISTTQTADINFKVRRKSDPSTAVTPVNTQGILYIDQESSTYEAIKYTGITENATGDIDLTGVSRDVPLSGTSTTGSGTGSIHTDGAKAYLAPNHFTGTMLANYQDGTLSGAWKFSTRPAYDATATGADPVVADITARDALSAQNGDSVYVTSTGVFYDYIGGAWAERGADTTANASETVSGRAEIATEAQGVAGTDTGETGAKMFMVPSKIAKAVQNDSWSYAADAEASDTYVITLTPAPSAYAAGQEFTFKANTANTGAATLNVNTLGAKTIKKHNDQDLATGDIESGQMVKVSYDGTNFQMMSQKAIDDNTNAHGIAVLTGTRGTASGNGTQDIAHGLSSTPTKISIAATAFLGTNMSSSNGFSDGSTHQNAYVHNASFTTGNYIAGSSANCVDVKVFTGSGDAYQMQATAAFDGTNVTLTWTRTTTSAPSNFNVNVAILAEY